MAGSKVKPRRTGASVGTGLGGTADVFEDRRRDDHAEHGPADGVDVGLGGVDGVGGFRGYGRVDAGGEHERRGACADDGLTAVFTNCVHGFHGELPLFKNFL